MEHMMSNICRHGLKRYFLATILLYSIIWPAWSLWGLNYTNSDDIAFGHIAWNSNYDWWDFADYVAKDQRRIQAYLGMPLVLLGNKIVEQAFGNFIFAGQIAFLFLSLIFALRGTLQMRFVTLIVFLFSTCFALHYYFTAPPGYKLIGLLWPICLLLSVVFLRRSLARGAYLPWAGILMFGLSMIGPEYNFLLAPIPIGLVLYYSPQARSLRVRYAAGYAFILLMVSVSYLVFRIANLSSAQNVTASFAGSEFLTTAAILVGKAFLPLGLFIGIQLPQSAIGGFPALPSEFDLSWLGQGLMSDPLYAVVFVGFVATFAFLLGGAKVAMQHRMALAASGLWLMLMPVATLSISHAYQVSVIAGYMQGHLASSYVQAGVLTLLACLLGGWQFSLGRRLLMAIPLSMLALVTLAYNLSNRDAMAANGQKWNAFALIAASKPFAAISGPDFWLPTGVSTIPMNWYNGTGNYWGDYAKFVLGSSMVFRSPTDASVSGDAVARYMVSPDGHPVAYLQSAGWTTLVADRPAALRIVSPAGDRQIHTGDWKCEVQCRIELTGKDALNIDTDYVEPLESTNLSLIAWMLMPRSGAFGTAPRPIQLK